MLSSLMLFAQQASSAIVGQKEVAYTPDWWFEKFRENGFIGCLSIVGLWLAVRYGPRILEAHVSYLNASTQATISNKEALEKQTELNEITKKQMDSVAATQAAAAAAAEALVKMHAGSSNTSELRIARGLELVELAMLHIAPQTKDEVRRLTDSIRYMANNHVR